jgi:TonB family protein
MTSNFLSGYEGHMKVCHCLAAIACLSVSMFSSAQIAPAQKLTASERIDELAAETSLDNPGVAPWHLHMSFDLFALNGKLQESGTVDEWWVSPTRHRIVVTSPSLKETLTTPPRQQAFYGRESYLVHLLLNQTVHPVDKFYNQKETKVSDDVRTFGKISLTCLQIRFGDSVIADQQYCMDPATKNLRVVLRSDRQSVARNEISHLRGTELALSNVIGFAGQTAIRGHVDLLESFDPTQVPGLSGVEPDPVPDTFTPPHLATRQQPRFPDGVQAGGEVTVRFLISKDGKPTSIDVIASSGLIYQYAVLEAIKGWKYSPMLRNGVPSEVDATVHVTFSRGSGTNDHNISIDSHVMDIVDR